LNSLKYKNPLPTVDLIVEYRNGIVLIERKFIPYGWALPGGFVDEGETLERAAIREAKEETNLDVSLIDLLYIYSNPLRDKRKHTISAVFIAKAEGELSAADDAKNAKIINLNDLPDNLCFDHLEILKDYIQYKNTGMKPTPQEMLKRHTP